MLEENKEVKPTILEEKLEGGFQLPIEISNFKKEIPENLYEDLELLETHDTSNNTIYENVFKPQTLFGEMCIHKWARYFTTNIKFLKDGQKLYSKIKPDEFKPDIIMQAWESWKDIKDNNYFIDQFQYIGIEKLHWLNKSSIFLSILSLYSILSPALNLLAPVALLIIPFVILRIMKIPITITSYTEILLKQLSNHSFGKLFTHWGSVSWSQRTYMLMGLGMYIYNIYQNVISCYQFYKNTITINKHFKNIIQYLHYTKDQISHFIKRIDHYSSYQKYKIYLQEKLYDLTKFYNTLKDIPLVGFHPKKIPFMGYTMKQFYLLYESEEIEEILLFSFGFNGYLDTLNGIYAKIKNGAVHKAKYKKGKKPVLKMVDSYYPIMQTDKVIPNTIDLSKNLIITGPNASGKTSLLKNTIINLLLSQQIGYGYYKKATITPFDSIHCYLNIPDTSSRDSLFQAEARRCYNILQEIEKEPDKKHFCIFDELFSGTNPYEAISSAYAYLGFIAKYKGVKFMLTTHFIRLCKLFNNSNKIENMNMKASIDNHIPTYYYKLVDGISTIKGGISVLKELHYPEEITSETEKTIDKL